MQLTVAEATAKRLQAVMTEKGVTKEELAERTHLPLKKIEKILNAEYKDVAVNNVFTISRAMDMPLTEFYQDEVFLSDNLL